MYAWSVYQVSRFFSENYSMCWGHQPQPHMALSAGCPVWQLEIISFISHLVISHCLGDTQICKDTDTHTHQRQRHQTQVHIHTHTLVSPALQTKPTFYTTHGLFIFLIQNQTFSPPILPPFLQTHRPDDEVLLAGAVHKMCFRQWNFFCDIEATESVKWVALMWKVPLMLILWHTHMHVHTHTLT